MVNPSPLIEVRRSARRRRTVSAYRDGDKIVVLMPARISRAEERRLVAEMVDKVTQREANHAVSGARASDRALLRRAAELSGSYLDGRARPAGVRWVHNMNSRWGSCTTADRTIRLSHRLQSMPSWVIDYVLMHELAHLLEPGHGPTFWQWVNRYPRTERARGYLEGVAMAAQLPGLSSVDSSEPELDWLCESPPAGGWSPASPGAVASGVASPASRSRSGIDSSGDFP
jgi:predicted metal-dependent hydrolase